MKKLLCALISVLMTLSISYSMPTPVASQELITTYEQIAPINRDAVIDKLIEEKVLTNKSSQDEITAALQDYIGAGTNSKQVSIYDKKKAGIIENKISEGLNIAKGNGNKFGQADSLENAENIPYGEAVKTVKVLVLLGDFADYTHNNIPEQDITRTYWTADSSVEHYQSLLFDDGYYTTPEGIKSPTFKQYFAEQSNGNLNIEGEVFGWYTAPKDAKYYGEDYGSSNNRRAKQYIIDITKAAVAAGVDLSEYDLEDPSDFDSDGDLEEADGVVDHLMVIHAGIGQEAGGGVLGDDSIWSHSSSVGMAAITGSDTKIDGYTTEAENGAVGLFAHEFVHDLGMPDDYDTIYSADGDIVEYWSIMAGGSWSGSPAGSMPSGINPYSRIMLGLIHGGDWINWEYKTLNSLEEGKMVLDTATMNTGNIQAILISLPKDKNKLYINTPAAGAKEFWGGTGPEIDNDMVTKVDLTGKTSASLNYDVWYNIEENWDAGFVQVSEDGENWTSLATSKMVTDFDNEDGYPSILDSLPAYTGSSNGWINETIDLSEYTGKEVFLRFRYATDWGTEMEGMYVDNVKVTSGEETIVSADAEEDFGAFTTNGFELSEGTKSDSHYYVAEWRSHLGVDEGLKANARAKVEYNEGLALWYINYNYTDNWVGVHPGFGQLGIVDANQYVYLNSGLGNGNESGLRAGYMAFVQLHDAAFSLDKAADMDLSIYSWAKNPNLSTKQAVPLFDDSKSYFAVKSPYSGLKLPKLGLQIRVTGNAPDYSRGEINISK
jgi:immune inhibitor A